MRHIIPISGKDSLATALFQRAKDPDLDYEYMFNPTGSELPETFEWLDRVQAHLGKPIHHVGKNLMAIIEDYNFFLPSRWARYCTKESKIIPFEKWIGKDECIVYYGIRADEERGGYINTSNKNITPVYPLKDAGIGIEMVYLINEKAGLKPPTFFWQKMYDLVSSMLGSDAAMKQFLKQWHIDLLFAWRSRTNCYHCFNMKKYEWVGLLQFYPELFWKAEALEHHGSEHYWNGKDYPLINIVDDDVTIMNKRAAAIIKAIQALRYSYSESIFSDFIKPEIYDEMFSTTSCGLFCGK